MSVPLGFTGVIAAAWLLCGCAAFRLPSVQSPDDNGVPPAVAAVTDARSQVTVGGLTFKLELDSPAAACSHLDGRIRILNTASQAALFTFPNLQTVGYRLLDTRGETRAFEPMITHPAGNHFTVPPHTEVAREFRVTLPTSQHELLPPGTYDLEVRLLDGYAPRLWARVVVQGLTG